MPIVEITMLSRLFDVECRSVFHIDALVDATNDSESAIAQIASFWSTHLKSIQTNQFTLYGGNYRNISTAGLPIIEVAVTDVVGTATGHALPKQTQGLVYWRAYSARPNASRKYIPAIVEEMNGSGGGPEAAATTAMNAFAQAFITHNTGVGGGDYRYVSVAKDPVTGLATAANAWETGGARPYWAVLRSRRVN